MEWTSHISGCGDTPTSPTASLGSTTTTTTTPPTSTGTCNKINEETAGPYPGDGSNGIRSTRAARNNVATSQIGLPKATNDLVYAVAGYEASIRNAAQVTLASDMVFSDGAALELATTSGDVTAGFTATLTVAI